MKKALRIFVLVVAVALGFSSCKTYHQSMSNSNVYLQLTTDDVELSEPFTADATTVIVLGIDWNRLFGRVESGFVGGLPILGVPVGDQTANYALYKLMQEHPGYDCIVYPQYYKTVKAPILGTPIYSKTTVQATARLGKLKK